MEELMIGLIIGMLMGWAAGALSVYYFLKGYLIGKVSDECDERIKKILRENGYEIKE